MKELLTEFLSDVLTEGSSAAKQAKAAGLTAIPGSRGLWSKTGKIPATHSTKGGTFTQITTPQTPLKQPKTTKPKAVKQPTPQKKQNVKAPAKTKATSENPKTIEVSIGQLPGGEGTLNAVKGIVEEGTAGLGTPESRAAEASVVLVINHLLTVRKPNIDTETFLEENNEVINSIVKELSQVKGSKLKPDWHNPVKNQIITAVSQVEKKFGRIQSVVWDNQEGRTAAGIKKKEATDRSDLYFVTENGEVIGVSLKKDGNVFLANQGYAKAIDNISRLTPQQSKQQLQDLKTLHTKRSAEQTREMLDYVAKNIESIGQDLSKLTRDQISATSSSKYDFLFDETGKISSQFIENLTNAAKRFADGEITDIGKVFTRDNGIGGNAFKLLTKALTALSEDETASTSKELASLLLKRRNVNREVTHALIEAVKTNPDIKSAMTGYMLETLDIPQTLFSNPFEGVSRVVTAYGDGTVDKDGKNVPMFVDDDMLRKTLNIPENADKKETIRLLKERFIIDAEADARAGIIRLKLVNTDPPPEYFYPTVATLEVRERGLGTSAVFELHQHDAWTAALSNRSVNPANWSDAQRKKNATETVKFLIRRLNDPITTDEEKVEIKKDLYFYKEILMSLTKPNKAKRK